MDATHWDERYAGRELVWGARPNRFVEVECAGLTPGRALDLACGEGRNAIWLATQGWTATGVDFSGVALRRAHDLAAEAGVGELTSWEQADLLTYRPDQGAFDLVVMAYLQVPAPLRRSVVRAGAGALSDGGTLFVVAHHTANLTEGTGGPQEAGVLYTAEDVADDLAAAEGVSVVRAEKVVRPVPGEGPEHHAVDTLLLARRG